MASIITLAGERLFAAKAQANEQLDIDTFIFANVPNQDPTAPINREEALPAEHEVHRQAVQQVGRINDNVVVYSTVLDSLTGPFEFNWVGMYSSVNQTLVAINHVPTASKTVTVLGTAGNTLNRNFGIEYSGIADLTGIDVSPETWQLDFTARLSGMDELTRQLAKDLNGKDWFIDDGFKVEPRSTLNTFRILPGVGYVSGLRVELENEHILTLQTYPQFVYVDAWFDGDANSVWKPQIAFTVINNEMDDYVDPQGRNHYVYKLAVINAADDVEDLRNNNGLADKEWVGDEVLISSEADTYTKQLVGTSTSILGRSIDGYTALKIKHGKTQKLWYAWKKPKGVISSFVENNDYGTAILITDNGTYEFLTPKTFDYRQKRNCLGWGVIGDGAAIQAAIDDIKNLERPFVIVPYFFAGWSFDKVLRLECEIKSESGKPLLNFNFDGPSLYCVKQMSCVDFKNFKISGVENSTIQSGLWVELDDFEPTRKITIDVDVRDISNSNDTQPCFGICVYASSSNPYDKYEIDVISSVKRITATSPGQVGSAGASKGLMVSINKSGMTNNINSIGTFVESVYPAQDGDGIHFIVTDHKDNNQRSTYSIKKAVVKDCAKRSIKNQAPNCTVESPWMDTTLADGGMTTVAFDSYGVNCTLSKPMLRNFSDSGSGDGIRSNGENFVCTSLNANIKRGRNLFRVHGGTYDIRGGVISFEESYEADNAAIALIEENCEGVLEMPKVKGATETGTAVSYQSASGEHTLIVSRVDGVNNLVRAQYGSPEITIERLIGSCKKESIVTLGDRGKIKLRSSDVKAGDTGMNISKKFEITGSNKLECGINGILVASPIEGSYIDGDINIKASKGGGQALVVNGLKNGVLRGIKSENFDTHISAKLSKSTVIANNVARGGGVNVNDSGSINNIKESNVEVSIHS